jgi:transcriptional regulator with XRE-family HTH domain
VPRSSPKTQHHKERSAFKVQIARLGRRVRSEREARGWTLEQAAEKFAVEPAHVRRLEAATANPTLSVLVSVARALGTTPTGLLASDRAAAPGQRPERVDRVRSGVVAPLAALKDLGVVVAGCAAMFSEGSVDTFWAAVLDHSGEGVVELVAAASSLISAGKCAEALKCLEAAIALAHAAKTVGRW